MSLLEQINVVVDDDDDDDDDVSCLLTTLKVASESFSSAWANSGLLCPVTESHLPWKSYVIMLMKSRCLYNIAHACCCHVPWNCRHDGHDSDR